MKNKVVKLTLDKILEVMLSHGVQPHKIESIMMDLGIPRHHVERILATNIVSSKKVMKNNRPSLLGEK